MKKKQIFWLIIGLIVVLVIVFVKVVPVWASLTGIVSLACGLVVGWWGKILYDKYIKEK
nr:MAG TPA: hypothetical protein [Caudoviricetes sp.]